MNSTESQKSWLAQGIFLFLFAALLWTATKLDAINPSLVWIYTIILIVVGVPCLIGGAIIYGRYKDVYDYEPAQFLNRPSSGKKIRGFLIKFVYLGFVLSLSGGLLFVLLQTGVINQFGN